MKSVNRFTFSRSMFSPFKSELTIVIFIRYKPRIATGLVVDGNELNWVTNEKKLSLLLKQCPQKIVLKTICVGN